MRSVVLAKFLYAVSPAFQRIPPWGKFGGNIGNASPTRYKCDAGQKSPNSLLFLWFAACLQCEPDVTRWETHQLEGLLELLLKNCSKPAARSI
jgi:hypothetical protein